MRSGVMRKMGIAILALAMIVSMAAAFAACGVSSDKSDSEAGARIDYIQKAETENGVVYWETAIKEEIDWEALGTDAQAAENALKASGKFIPWQVVTISRDGRVLD